MLGEEVRMISGEDGRRVIVTPKTEDKWGLLMKLDKICVDNPGVVMRLNLSGARPENKWLENKQVDAFVFCHSKGVNCAGMSAINDLWEYSEDSKPDAEKLLELEPIAVKSLGGLHAWMEQNLGRYHLNKVEVPSVHELSGWIDALKNDGKLVILRLRGLTEQFDEVDHCVVADGRNGVIIDSYEEKKLELVEEVLQKCVGSLIEVLDARELFVLLIGKRKRNGRRNETRKRTKKDAIYDEKVEMENITAEKKKKVK